MANELLKNGFTLVRHAFPTQFTAQLRREIQYLHQTKQLYANSTHVHLHGSSEPILLQKHHIYETELVRNEIRVQVPTLKWLYETQLVSTVLHESLPSWLNLEGDTVKLQYNQGQGGCFPMHFDSYGDDGKCLTAVLYLNDGWKDGDGGEIVFYPFPQSKAIVQPNDGDLVIFSSQHMLHRVLPAFQSRFCLTTWIYQSPQPRTLLQNKERNMFYNKSVRASGQEAQTINSILNSSFRRHLAKLYYAREWKRSLLESHHNDSDAFEKYIATHEQEIQVIEAATNKLLTSMSQRERTSLSSAQELLKWLETNKNIRPISWF